VTSLFIPVILLLVRNYVRNNRRKGPSADRNPGDGADQLDGKDNDKNDDDNDDDDDDDDDGKGMS
jgi:flagellar biosynthesis/type III secretory pathway M-ring protein FliF/YscJ